MARADVTQQLALWRAYQQALFRVFDEGRPITFRIGRTSARLDKLLERHGARRWAHITAWNPSSVPLSKAENARRQRRLLAELKRAGFTILEGDGADPKGRWTPEPTAFVMGIGVRDARRLGRQYDQLAIVVGQRGKPARLVACQPGLPQSGLAKRSTHAEGGPDSERAERTPPQAQGSVSRVAEDAFRLPARRARSLRGAPYA